MPSLTLAQQAFYLSHPPTPPILPPTILILHLIFPSYHRLHGFKYIIPSARTFAISIFHLDYGMGKSLGMYTKTIRFIPFLNSSLQINGSY